MTCPKCGYAGRDSWNCDDQEDAPWWCYALLGVAALLVAGMFVVFPLAIWWGTRTY